MQGTEYEPGIIPRTVDAIFSSDPAMEGRTEVSFSYVVSDWSDTRSFADEPDRGDGSTPDETGATFIRRGDEPTG
jgi:hypothetical protein